MVVETRAGEMQDLVNTIEDVFTFILASERRGKIDSHRAVAARLLQQTVECGFFIMQTKLKGDSMSKIRADFKTQFSSYRDTFHSLKVAFSTQHMTYPDLLVYQSKGKTKSIGLPRASRVSFVPEYGCLPGTRQTVTGKIIDWASLPSEPSTQRIFWLRGPAGCGKSAICHTIARYASQLGRLGSSFFFDASDPQSCRLDLLFPTITSDLAEHIPGWGARVAAEIQDQPLLVYTSSFARQWEHFIVNPAKLLELIGPVVIVIDAIDESADQDSLKEIYKIIPSRLNELPPNFRIIFSTRDDPGIEEIATSNPFVDGMGASILANPNHPDLGVYMVKRLQAFPTLQPIIKDHSDDSLTQLTQRSQGLFQWASTSCNFISSYSTPGWDPVEQLQFLLRSPSVGLDALYSTILNRIFEFKNEEDPRLANFRTVLGWVTCVQEPLTIRTLSALCAPDKDDFVRSVVAPMGTFMSTSSVDYVPVRILHQSFRDYLCTSERSQLYSIDVQSQHPIIARTCLSTMNRLLCFNICKLETSSILNDDFPDLTQRIWNNIPDELSYACRFWAIHLKHCTMESHLVDLLMTFLSSKFLFWLEVLSLIKQPSIALEATRDLLSWSTGPDSRIETLARDAEKLISSFSSVISQSAPHIYLSALPFAPTNSAISQEYLPKFPRRLKVVGKPQTSWSVIQKILLGHSAGVVGAVYSSDGTKIISASQDGSIRLWQSETGDVNGSPFSSDDDPITCISLSPRSLIVASGSISGEVRLRDAQSGKIIATLRAGGYGASVSCFRFSQDGKYMASGSTDGSVGIWVTIGTGIVVRPGDSRHDFAVTSTAFTPDSKSLLSGSEDGIIKIWRLDSHPIVGAPWWRSQVSISSLAISSSLKVVISSSNSQQITLLDFNDPFRKGTRTTEEHRGYIMYATPSPDSRHLVSGTSDGTISLWNFDTLQPVGQAMKGHKGEVQTVAFSPDGRHIVSGADDGRICVWDTNAILGGSSTVQASNMQSDSVGSDFLTHGWVFGEKEERLFWVPSPLRQSFVKLPAQLEDNPDATSVDLTNFVHGTEWMKCYDPEPSSSVQD
ncbi:WD40 repeat-like protein [Sistotremastrum suecicum HHB10207 ss-3]|uniref:WD40 repeat-like protein n=1 Tax=Sistotremastrum suecicum HHB10207 ss-3 TaxID=1314776 RepID=A0A166FU60_9AGAM|nr:WD40 repeat-like protein [Sistotremastrum suecicum HHB10207 ss-3]